MPDLDSLKSEIAGLELEDLEELQEYIECLINSIESDIDDEE